MISRRQFLFWPLKQVSAGPRRPKMSELDRLTRQLARIQTAWPDRANKKPPVMTNEELTQKMHARIGVDEIHSKFLGEHTKWIRYCVYWIGGDGIPTAGRGEL